MDLNHPITSEQHAQRILDRAEYRLKSVEGLRIDGQPAPPAYVCITSVSDHYFPESSQTPIIASFYGFKIPDFLGPFPTIRDALRARERQSEIFKLMRSIETHSHLPSTFDGELPSAAFSEGEHPRMQIGQVYLAPGPDGKEVPARLTSATVDTTNAEAILSFDNGWICKVPMSQAELDDYERFPDTFFGVYHRQGRKPRTPIELLDFMHESYKRTAKEKLVEWMADAPDFDDLKNLSQPELSEIYCERCIYSITADQERKKSKCLDQRS